ncbi:MAG TPA: hypothetical protein VFF21_03595 [Flavobacteriaceae bacterium]|nr:hypothetical protein [Flavobacteriaceae bacterium]
MKALTIIPLYDAVGGYAVTIISIVFTLAVIGALVLFAKRTKKRRNMVQNKPKKNDYPGRNQRN